MHLIDFCLLGAFSIGGLLDQGVWSACSSVGLHALILEVTEMRAKDVAGACSGL